MDTVSEVCSMVLDGKRQKGSKSLASETEKSHSTPMVTIGIPVYKRLEYLPNVLKMVAAQDHPNIDLMISDNGMHGNAVPDIVRKHYPRPFRFRQNSSTVGLSRHFNQIINEAEGKYFLMLADDDEISANYVSVLVQILEQNPQAAVAIGRQEIINETGVQIRQSKGPLPPLRTASEFIRDAWQAYRYRFECFATFLARTEKLKACGGFPDFNKGTHNDDALLIKLILGHYVALSSDCSFRWRVYDNSHGWSLSIWDLAMDTRQFLQFLRRDPAIRRFAAAHPAEWKQSKGILVEMAWGTYFSRWRKMYQSRLAPLQWVAAAFAMPPILTYYRNVASTLLRPSTLKKIFGK